MTAPKGAQRLPRSPLAEIFYLTSAYYTWGVAPVEMTSSRRKIRPQHHTGRVRGHSGDGPIAGEDALITRIRRGIPSAAGGILRLGIGDDAAILRPRRGRDWVVTCDQFIEDVHFVKALHPPEVVGYKALARAASDLAAMGAVPRVFLLSLALPASCTGVWLTAMTHGMARAAREFGLTLAGGDTARTPARNAAVTLNLTVLGEIEAGRGVQRNSALPGDAIFVTGVLGAAHLGLEIVLRGFARSYRRLVAPHFYPKPCLEVGRWLLRRRIASAMMDLSDGLSTDLPRLCRASSVGARLYESAIPRVAVPAALHKKLQAKGTGTSPTKTLDERELALHGGEDYGLLFTVRKRMALRVPAAFRGTRITRIGEIVSGGGVILIRADGSARPLAPGGWDHFRA
jgi:thiamine-monophosphate kinase